MGDMSNKKIIVPKFALWDHHYFGWKGTIDFLRKNSGIKHGRSVVLEPSIENVLCHDRENNEHKIKLYQATNWVGFVHHHPVDSREELRLLTIIRDERNKKIFNRCKGLFVLTDAQKQYYKKIPELTGIPISRLYHPTAKQDEKSFYDIESLNKQPVGWPRPRNCLVNVGDHCRLFRRFAKLRTSYLKCALFESELHWRGPRYKIRRDRELSKNTIVHNKRFTDADYDYILCNNIQYAQLDTPNASNYVLECIVRGTPIFISKNNTVVEYLGEDYPMYQENFKNNTWCSALSDKKLIQETHEYLLDHPFKEKFTLQNFLHDFVNSEVYKKI